MVVGPPRAEQTVSLPSRASTRSAMLLRPVPSTTASGSKPGPLSDTEKARLPPESVSVTVSGPRPCFETLVRASATQK